MSLLVVMADNVMVSHVGVEGNALAAVSQANSITNFFNAVVTGLASGSIVLVSQYWGKKDMQRIRPICAVVFMLCLSAAILFIVLILLFPGHILSLVISREETGAAAIAMEYFPIMCLSYLPFAITASFIGMMKGVEVVRVTLYATLISLISNIGLNYVFIFGKLGLPAMGVRGAAYATVIARLLEAALVSYYFLRRQQTLPIRFAELFRAKKWAWNDYVRYGLPVGLTDAQWALIGMLKMVIIGQMGKIMINASAVTDMLMNLGTLFTFALAGGACVVVGKAVGQKDYVRVKQYAVTIQIMFLFFGVLMSLGVFLLRRPFVSLYRLDDETAKLAMLMIGLSAFTLIGTTYHASSFVGINRGAGDNRFVMIVDMVCGWLIVLPAAAVSAFVFRAPFHIVYLMTRIDQCFKWLIAFLRLRGDKWIHNVTRKDEIA